MIHIRGHTTDFGRKVESLEVNHAPSTEVDGEMAGLDASPDRKRPPQQRSYVSSRPKDIDLK
jgi:hypothetical protein